jgi:RND superfamily putative drug exporter
VDWPKIRHENRASKSWSRWAQLVVRRRYLAAAAAVVVLGVLVASFAGIRIGLASSASLAKSGKAYDALQTLRSGGVTTGVLTPMEVLVADGRGAEVAAAAKSVAGVRTVVVPHGPGTTAGGYQVVVVIPDEETVNSATVTPVRGVKKAVDGLPGVVGVAGVGADQIDFLSAVYGNFPLMLGIIALLTIVLLARAFRSIVLPVKAVILNLISLAATLGFMVLFWQHGYGSNTVFGVSETGAVTFWIPLMVFAFLFGLSMDYEVFILARIREEYDREGSTDAAVVAGLGRTGRLITSAALILFLAFVALASGPGTDLKTFATALGFGVLIDATVVRSLLVPALVSMFGSWNWWLPGWAARVLRVPAVPAHARASSATVAG